MSLRSVAQGAGASLGSLNYHIGDKAALIARLIEEERVENRKVHTAWLTRTAQVDLASPGTLATIILAYLDEASEVRREAALTGCEFLLDAVLDPAPYAGIATLLDEEDDFWTQLLGRDHGARAPLFGNVIADYCRDELPFSIAAGRNPDYRLLRAATVGRLAEGLAGTGDGLSRSFEALVAACGDNRASLPLPIDLPAGSKKAELAQYIAELIAEQGVASITHRLVATRAGVPNSSVAHHFRTRGDLLDGGMGALILDMRSELEGASSPARLRRRGPALIRATHSIALAAARASELIPFALDMRRRRAENVRDQLGKKIAGPTGLDGAAVQAAVLAMIGSSFATKAKGGVGAKALSTAQLTVLRDSFR